MLTNLVKTIDPHSFTSSNKHRDQILTDLNSKIKNLNTKYQKSVQNRINLEISLQKLQKIIEEQHDKQLDMKLIRDQIKLKDKNNTNLEEELTIVNKLIDEIKEGEGQWREWENQQRMGKQLLSELEPELDELLAKNIELDNLLGSTE